MKLALLTINKKIDSLPLEQQRVLACKAAVDMGKRARGIVFIYPFIMFLFLWGRGVFIDHGVYLIPILIMSLLFSARRYKLSSLLLKTNVSDSDGLLKSYLHSSLASAFTLGLFAATLIFREGLSVAGIVMLLATTGMVSGAIVSMTQYRMQFFYFLWLAWFPIILVSLYIGGTQDSFGFMIAFLICAFILYFCLVGKKMSDEYWLGLLTQSKLETLTEELKRNKDDLQLIVNHKTKDLLRAKKLAEDASQTKSIFLANMSHELRTPMHGILSFAALGLKKSDSSSREKLNQYFANIDTSGQRLLSLLNNLLDLSKLETGKMEYFFKRYNLQEVLQDCLLEQQASLTAKDLQVEVLISTDKLYAAFDQQRISQVIVNLLSNAIKFSPNTSTITIELSKASLECNKHSSESAIKFRIRDEGIGIPDDELEAVFDQFIQSKKTRSGASGTGLGLAIVKDIIEEGHQGFVEAEKSDSGANIYFTLPTSQVLAKHEKHSF